jgi:hypothetical protein
MYYVGRTNPLKYKFPQCAAVNLEASSLLEIGDISRKLRLCCG